MSNEVLSTAQAAEYLGITPRRLQRWLSLGQVEGTKLGTGRTSSWVISRDEVERLKVQLASAKHEAS